MATIDVLAFHRSRRTGDPPMTALQAELYAFGKAYGQRYADATAASYDEATGRFAVTLSRAEFRRLQRQGAPPPGAWTFADGSSHAIDYRLTRSPGRERRRGDGER